MQEYFSILTNKGIDLLLKAAANKTQIALSKMSVSDDEGDLNQSITALNGVKHSFSINSLIVDEADPHQLIAEGIINADVGGFYINKAGIYTANDELFAVAKLPRTYKPKLAEGSAKDITIKFIMQVDNAGSVTLKVDNNVVLATRNWAISNFAAKNHNHDERYVKKDEASDGTPIGAYLAWSSQDKIPAGYLLCDGRSLKKSEYTELFAVIGYTYGGSGENFNIPNFSDGKFMRSVGGNAAALGVAQADTVKSHNHSWFFGGQKNSATGAGSTASAGNTRPPNGANEIPTTFEGGVETRPYNMSVVVLIKAKNVREQKQSEIDKTPYATESKAGIVKIKNTITGVQEDVAVSEKAVAGIASIGINQTWQDVLAERQNGVVYTNTTGRPIQILVSQQQSSSSQTCILEINNVESLRNVSYGNADGCIVSAIIPAGATYKVVYKNYTPLKWFELR
jgi:phage-related tail fiber protein-like protein|nr:MAG TPA: tail collar fiber protein [Caudoviricetes sp.]DAS87754.1 MAG TPA: tail collar fiber protein [Caudoviricetes sp.]DAT20125.1 MAG TPA: tail collar fiber protein [Caudoviricetes sp.]